LNINLDVHLRTECTLATRVENHDARRSSIYMRELLLKIQRIKKDTAPFCAVRNIRSINIHIAGVVAIIIILELILSHGQSKLNKRLVRLMRKLHDHGWNNKKLREKFKVNRTTVTAVVNNHRWRDA
jgi:hypothetical protein